MNIHLNVFTNCVQSAPSCDIVNRTYNSFLNTFGPLPVTLYVDPHPYPLKYNRYIQGLKKTFKEIVKTSSLSDGYIRSILNGTAEWLFQLEGDWVFQTPLIKNSLDEITTVMREKGIYHFRFNKRDTIIKGWDRRLDEHDAGKFKFCVTDILSNNPHIIHRPTFVKFIKDGKIVQRPGSKGIEEVISSFPDTWGAIYGPLGYPRTVLHIDGRGKYRKVKK